MIFFCAAAGVTLASLSGCTAQAITQKENLLAAIKAESIKDWEADTLDGRLVMESLRTRVAMLITNFDSVFVEMEDSILSVKGSRPTNGGIGSAVPISNDGYFLTAAHVIDEAEALHIVLGLSEFSGRTKAEGIPARVVWKSQIAFWPDEDWSPGEPLSATDIAIIHAEIDSLWPTEPIKLSDKAPDDGEPVIIAGWSLINIDSLQDGVRFATGKLVAVVELDARGISPAFMTLYHDAPVAAGDSGGPLLDRFGNLIGITSVSPVELENTATATMPDTNWLWEVIENDRLQRSTNAAACRPILGTRSN